MKRIYAFLTALVLTMQIFAVGVYAADTPGWTKAFCGDTAEDDSSHCIKNSSEIERKYKYAGTDALYVVYKSSGKVNETDYAEVTNVMNASTVSGTEYVFTFYMLGKNTVDLYLGDTKLTSLSELTTYENADKIDGIQWKKGTYTFTAAAASNKLSLRFVKMDGIYIDNVSLLPTAGGADLIADGGFENGIGEVVTDKPEVEFDQTPYTPKNVMLSGGNNMICLNWRNPVTEPEKIAVYDITDGGETLLSDTVDTTTKKLIFHQINGLSAGNYYQYKIVFTFADKGDFVYYLGGTPGLPSDVTYGTNADKNTWKFNTGKGNSEFNFIANTIQIDNTVSHGTGKASLHIKSNVDKSNDQMNWKMFANAMNVISSMEAGKKYQVFFWGKSVDVATEGAGPESLISNTSYDGTGNNNKLSTLLGTTTSDDNGWVKITRTYSCQSASENEFRIVMQSNYVEDLWFDDIEIYELADDGSVPADAQNLCADSGFENLVSETVGAITNLTASPSVGKLDLSWNISKDDKENIAEIELYEKYFDKWLYRGTVSKSAESIALTNLKNGVEHTFRLVPVNADNVAGTAVEVSGTPILEDYEISAPVLKNSANIVTDKLSGAGSYSVTLSVKNNKIDAGMPVEQFVAVYYPNGTIYKVFSTKAKIKRTGLNQKYTDVSTSFDVPSAGCTAEYFVFDSRTTLNIVGEPNPHTVFAD